MGSNKSEKRKPKSAVYRSFWASVVYFHLRLISTKSHKREMTRNQVYRQRYRGFESHPLRQKKAHPPGWAFFWHYDPGAGGIRKAALSGMPVACRNRCGFSAEKGSHPLRQLIANYAGSRRLFYAAHEKVISFLLRCSSLQNRDRFAGSRFCFSCRHCGRLCPLVSNCDPAKRSQFGKEEEAGEYGAFAAPAEA